MGIKSKILEAIKKVFGIKKYKHWKKVKGVGQFPQNNPKEKWEEILKGNDYY